MSHGTLKVRVDKFLEGQLIGHAVPVRVRAARPTTKAADAVGPMVMPAPASAYHTDQWASEALPPGTYDLEAVLPSGEVLADRVEVKEGKVTESVLRGEQSLNEWRSWAHFSGVRDASASARSRARPTAKGALPVDTPRKPPVYQVTAGTRAWGASSEFPPDSWDGWFDYLKQRFELARLRIHEVDDMQLVATGEVHVEVHHGYPGEPTRVAAYSSPGDAFSEPNVGRTRPFIAVTSVRGTRLVSVPWPWFPPSPPYPFFELLVSETPTELLCEPVIRDERLGGLLAYLNAGRMGLAGELLAAARTALFEKYTNPLGAAAGGYVLLSTDASDGLEDWPYWLDNLANNFPHLPDGAILRAKWLLDRGRPDDTDEAAHLLGVAYERGVPFFTAGIVWLIEGLLRVAPAHEGAEEILRVVRTVARSIDLSRGVTSFHLPSPDERGTNLRMRLEHSPMQGVGVPA